MRALGRGKNFREVLGGGLAMLGRAIAWIKAARAARKVHVRMRLKGAKRRGKEKNAEPRRLGASLRRRGGSVQ